MHIAHALLIEATEKLIELSIHPDWAIQLPSRCPPVLWFGNALSERAKVVTLGANPSRSEFLSDSAVRALKKAPRSPNQSQLVYREPPKNRFRVLLSGETFADILTSQSLQTQIIESYESYFFSGKFPYTRWFGKDSDDSYNVEGFLRGLGASYYRTDSVRLQAVHIDLFPFTTLDDFVAITKVADAALFADGWAQRLVSRLVEWVSPRFLIVFGRTNCRYFAKYIDPSMNGRKWEAFNAGEYFIGQSQSLGLPVVGLSTNLGNPKHFNKVSLRAFGAHVRKALQ